MPKHEDWLAWKLAEERGEAWPLPETTQPTKLHDEKTDNLPRLCDRDHPVERLRI